MKAYDPTQSLRQMFYKPDVFPFCVLLIILLIVFMVVTPVPCICSNMEIPEATFFQDQPAELLTFIILADGAVVLGHKIIENISTIHSRIKEDGNYKYLHKVLLKADCRAEFGRVQEVLKEIKKAEVDTIGLIVY